MQIIIRGQKVKTQLIAKSLAYIQKDHYKPNFLVPSHYCPVIFFFSSFKFDCTHWFSLYIFFQDKRLTITFGYNTKSKEQYGVMMYHKNRLIKAYKRVGCQLKVGCFSQWICEQHIFLNVNILWAGKSLPSTGQQ